MSARHNHQPEIFISNQKSPYIAMEHYLQQYFQGHIQEYTNGNVSRHKPGESRTGLMLLSLLIVQDNIPVIMVWRAYRALFWLPREWWPAHTISAHQQPFVFVGGGTRLDIITHILSCYHVCFPFTTSQLKFLLPCVHFWGKISRNLSEQVQT